MRFINFIILLFIPAICLAHKINIFATVEGNKIYTQSYASDGGKIKGGEIEVYDKSGNKLLTGKTDSLGEFSFVIPKKDDLKIVVIGGMGHRAETVISADELPDIKKEVAAKVEKKEVCKEIPSTEITVIDTILLERIVERVVDGKINPVLRLIAEQKKDRIRITEVIGGIGYIFGIVGIIAFFMKRKNNV
ncbi:MAG: hypothetical protein ABIL70_04030 [candidate division WOR-3 bacterium]